MVDIPLQCSYGKVTGSAQVRPDLGVRVATRIASFRCAVVVDIDITDKDYEMEVARIGKAESVFR